MPLNHQDKIGLLSAAGLIEGDPSSALNNKRASQILQVIAKAYSADGCSDRDEQKLLIEIGLLPPLPDAPGRVRKTEERG